MEPREGLLFSLGNLLLDITAVVDPRFLVKYNLLPNNSTLAQAENIDVFDYIEPVSFSAGGSALNTLRVTQRILNFPKACTLMGAVGKDVNAEKLIREATKDGVYVNYQEIPDLPTGRCAVLVNGENRSLLTQLGAAQRFNMQHLMNPDNFRWVESASYFYITGYFLLVSLESAKEVCTYSHEKHKPLLLNINATWVAKRYKPALMEMMPYVDVVFGNEEEILAIGEGSGYGIDLAKIAFALSQAPKLSTRKARARIVVVTRASKPVLVYEGHSQSEYPVVQLPPGMVTNTSGAGDAFVGGFLAEFIQEKNIDVCVNKGIWSATQLLQQRCCKIPTFESNSWLT